MIKISQMTPYVACFLNISLFDATLTFSPDSSTTPVNMTFGFSIDLCLNVGVPGDPGTGSQVAPPLALGVLATAEGRPRLRTGVAGSDGAVALEAAAVAPRPFLVTGSEASLWNKFCFVFGI